MNRLTDYVKTVAAPEKTVKAPRFVIEHPDLERED